MKMKSFKKWLVAAAAATALLSLAACSSGGSSSSSPLKKIQDKRQLVVATSADFAPFEFQMIQNGKNTIVGSDIDLANAIGKDLGVSVKVENMDFNNILAAVQSGKADIAIAGLSATKDREQTFDFSNSYFTSQNVVVVKKSELNNYTSVDSLKGKQVAAQKGSVQEGVVDSQLKAATKIPLTDTASEINELKSGQVSAVVLDSVVAEGYVKANSDLALANIKLQTTSGDASFAVAMPKNSGDLKTKINATIKKLQQSNQIQQMIDKNITLQNQTKG